MIIPKNVVAEAGYASLINIKWTMICSYRMDPRIYWSGPEIRIDTTIFDAIVEVITVYACAAKAFI